MEGNAPVNLVDDIKLWARNAPKTPGRRPILTQREYDSAIKVATATGGDTADVTAEILRFFDIVPNPSPLSSLDTDRPVRFVNRAAKRARRQAQTRARRKNR